MRIIDMKETTLWLSKRNLLDSAGKVAPTGFFKALDSQIPSDSGHKTALSRVIASFFENDDEALLWIHEFGIWPSSEDWHLFEALRQSLGEQSTLSDKPGHLFSSSDLTAVRSLVALVLYFIWGAILYSPATGLVVKISHDEFLSVYVRDRKDASNVTDSLKKFLR